MQRRIHRIAGFYRIELLDGLVALSILLIISAILVPFFAQSRDGVRNTCLSNVKRIALGMMMYAGDYDERFPPARSFYKTANGRVLRVNWGISYHLEKDGKNVEIMGLLHPYVRNNPAFRCTDIEKKPSWNPFTANSPPPERETFMYNDLAATEKTDTFSTPARTVLIAEGEDIERNVGHAWEPQFPPQQATFDGWGKCRPERGATVRNAPTRHQGGANYAFADGHSKWLRPEMIFFPPRTSADLRHDGDTPGPNPGGRMIHENRFYEATFHLK